MAIKKSGMGGIVLIGVPSLLDIRTFRLVWERGKLKHNIGVQWFQALGLKQLPDGKFHPHEIELC